MSLDSALHPQAAAVAWFRAHATQLQRVGPYLLALLVVILVQSAVVIAEQPPELQGLLHGTDDYMRLLRVTQLAETGAWFDNRIPRGAAPEGMVLHWTRPMDLVLLAGGWLLSPWLGLEQGLLWWGIFVSPLIYLIMVLALVWATQPLFDIRTRCLLLLAVVAQAPLLTSSMVGHADHHMLLHLTFVTSIGLHLRSHLRPELARWALAAGAALGFGLWLSTEALVLIGASFAGLSLLWLLQGARQARANLWHALGLAGMITLALLVERPAVDYLAVEYDRISIVHLFMAGLALAFWAVVNVVERRSSGNRRIGARVALATVGAAAAGAAMFAVFPLFFGGPEVMIDPRLRPILYDLVSEMRPLLPHDRSSFGEFLVYLGPSLVVLPFLAWLLLRERDQPSWAGWLHVALCLLLFLPLAIAMRRFAPFTEILLAIPLAAILGRVLPLCEGISPMVLRVVVRSGLMVLLLVGWIYGEKLILPTNSVAQGGWAESCNLREVLGPLNDPQGLGRAPQIIMAHYNYGPELLYRSPHSVVAAPYHRNTASVIDSDAFFGAADGDQARRIAQARNVGLVMLCRNGPAVTQASMHGENNLAVRLRDGLVPSWLAPVDLAGASVGDYLIFQVVPGGAPDS